MLIALILGCTETENHRPAPNQTTVQALTIQEFKAANYDSGNYTVEGYVVAVYKCPPCPEGAMCKPCERDHITVSDKNQPVNGTLKSYEMKIIATNEFEVGKKYRLSITATNQSTLDQPNNDVMLIDYELIG
jgi:hypothetical protein